MKAILGWGLSPKDRHKRISQGDFFHLFDGSEEGHAEMLEFCLFLEQLLEKEEIRFQDLNKEKFMELLGAWHSE